MTALFRIGLFVCAAVSASAASSDYDECMSFLTENMPPRDVGNIPEPVLNETIVYALLTRTEAPFTAWTSDIPFSIFQNYVLPYASLSEPRENWRKFLFDALLPTVSAH